MREKERERAAVVSETEPIAYEFIKRNEKL
jgi:hypothetical protein